MAKSKVKFMPEGEEYGIGPDESVLQLAQREGVPIHSVCNGVPSCTECMVKVLEGEHNISPPSAAEINLIGSGYYLDQRRLSCQIKCFGDVTIDLSNQKSKKNFVKSSRRKTENSFAVKGSLIDQEG